MCRPFMLRVDAGKTFQFWREGQRENGWVVSALTCVLSVSVRRGGREESGREKVNLSESIERNRRTAIRMG